MEQLFRSVDSGFLKVHPCNLYDTSTPIACKQLQTITVQENTNRKKQKTKTTTTDKGKQSLMNAKTGKHDKIKITAQLVQHSQLKLISIIS